MELNNVVEQLKVTIQPEHIKINEPLKKYTYTKTGGNADIYITPTSDNEVQHVLRVAKQNNLPVTFLGNGSNIIIRDGGIRGIVISLLGLTKIEVNHDTITAGSGAAIIEVSRTARDYHLTGLEFACGIPGSVGGAVYMNAGAYGGEVKDVIVNAKVINHEGEMMTLTKEDLALDYRTSIIQQEQYVVLEATFKLQQGDLSTIQSQMDVLTERRETKQPLEYPSCGSVFRRPPGYFAGKLIQDAGLQGHIIGGVQVSEKHAGFIVNINNGTATDYELMIAHIQKTVFESSGIELEPEVRVIGEPSEQ
ncbi:UDP-N-acetylmuramate dehydrogenase [Macrococcus armenti]|uniref:UDP-N-acetylmuramate dehydrogenase n=1 Tax=Macrococcus armenti TaxID=2875764 RepID=UPI001CC8F07F|nr:UDP-N-acetylmuramate dehydrogenase [Macrococcus armenti]UBH13665.1 UDP-N-acetylmuramate dehydrogenase [Macrococcus armenti]